MSVLTAFRGEQALRIAEEEQPDIILLDIMMPEVDGFEVCRRLKENKATKSIPVIFITAKTSREGKLKGLDTGAADYITKPIDLDETIARINTQLKIQRNHRENLNLQNRLSEMRKQAAVGHVVEGIAHNLNNLLGVVVGYLDLMRNSFDSKDRFDRSSEQLDNGIRRMVEIVRQLTTVAEFDEVRKSPHSLEIIVENGIQRFHQETGIHSPVKMEMHGDDVDIDTNAEMLEDAIVRLLKNSWESYDRLAEIPEVRPLHIEVGMSTYMDKPAAHIQVIDEGCGLPEDMLENVFDPFVTTNPAVGRGMGLTIARHSIRTLGGDIHITNQPDGGACVAIKHPLSDELHASLMSAGLGSSAGSLPANRRY